MCRNHIQTQIRRPQRLMSRTAHGHTRTGLGKYQQLRVLRFRINLSVRQKKLQPWQPFSSTVSCRAPAVCRITLSRCLNAPCPSCQEQTSPPLSSALRCEDRNRSTLRTVFRLLALRSPPNRPPRQSFPPLRGLNSCLPGLPSIGRSCASKATLSNPFMSAAKSSIACASAKSFTILRMTPFKSMSRPRRTAAFLKVRRVPLSHLTADCFAGTLIKRHRIPKPAPQDDQTYTITDLNLGVEITLYGKTIRLVNCDKFTESFLTKLGVRVNGSEDYPADSHSEIQHTLKVGVCVHSGHKCSATHRRPSHRNAPTRRWIRAASFWSTTAKFSASMPCGTTRTG